jgi:chloramphenicol 3-O-phosphotransferase
MIIHLNGWPGVGKLTIARHVSARIGGYLLDNHTIYNVAFALTEFRTPEFYELVRTVRDIAFDRIADMTAAKPVIMTNAYGPSDWGRENWDAIRDLAKRRGSPFFAVTITCSDEEHRKRIVAEDRKPHGKLTDRDQLPAMLGPMIEEDAEYLLRLDTTGVTPEESAGTICDWIEGIHKETRAG